MGTRRPFFCDIAQEDFNHVKELISEKRNQREAIIDSMCISVRELLKEANITATVTGRPKHFYSIYKEVYEEKTEFSQLFDLYGIRIISTSIPNCYQILGYIHSKYKPVEGRLDILPLNPTCINRSTQQSSVLMGIALKFKIEQKKCIPFQSMELPAHWSYKEKRHKQKGRGLSWLRQILDEERQSSNHFIENLKVQFI